MTTFLFDKYINQEIDVIKEFNVNDCVMVRLTDAGIAELKRQHEELVKTFPSVNTKFNPPKVDADGFSRWQLHSLMSTLGHLMHLGFSVPFETTILIDFTEQQ